MVVNFIYTPSKYDADKIKEFDSLEELRSFDEEYINNSMSNHWNDYFVFIRSEKVQKGVYI